MTKPKNPSWFDISMDAFALAAESNMVIAARLGSLALGGPNAVREAERMVSEKVAANLALGADLQFHTALDQAINGVTTVRVMRGGTVEVVNAPDRKVLNAALLPKTRLSAALSAQARAVKATRET